MEGQFRAPAKGGEFLTMPLVKLREGESFEGAVRRFKKQCEKAGILTEVRKREHYEKPSVRAKLKRVAAQKRAAKQGRKRY